MTAMLIPLLGDICDAHGQQIPPDEVPPLREPPECAWAPFTGPSEFLLADLLFRKMSTTRQNELFDILNMMLEAYGDASPFSSSQDMYNTIDSAHVGGVPWECLVSMPSEDLPHDAPIWKRKPYEIWYRNPDAVLRSLLDNPDFHGEFDYTPYIELDEEGKRCWTDFFSGNFAWRHSVEYHPGYLSIGNVHNNVRRAHCGAVVPFIFFAIPKSDRKYDGDPEFRTFKWQLYHRSLSTVLDHIKPSMSTPVVRRCPDGHFRRVVFDLGPVIADYPEQALPRSQEYTDQLISTFDPGVLWDSYGIDDDIVPFTNDFPRADIHELLSPDLLHQVIKGTFKDHLVEWVGVYLTLEHGKAQAEVIMDEIDHRIAAVPPFPNLRWFPDGRRFKQWTGDDSKALMKDLWTFTSFLDFCYHARRTHFNEDTLNELDLKVHQFQDFREVFRESGVRPTGFALPRQHSLTHYHHLIQEFGAPYGLCSSITESRHITAVKKPWRRSNRYNALGQMLQTNQRLDKLAALQTDYISRGLLPLRTIRRCCKMTMMTMMVLLSMKCSENLLPSLRTPVSVFHSAVATYYAPSDMSGRYGMYCERIRCTPNWCREGPRRDTVFLVEDDDQPGLLGMSVVRLRLLFSFKHVGVTYPCALVDWFDRVGQRPDPNTGLWIVKPDLRGRSEHPSAPSYI
ncbi:C2H2-type domain-containing protein [Salix suchowensis]|nr:C2H2-type domain-containing protein [Salix suchowensis]